jgi:hypothetical protein
MWGRRNSRGEWGKWGRESKSLFRLMLNIVCDGRTRLLNRLSHWLLVGC